jgi:dUTP pyrophosphatase
VSPSGKLAFRLLAETAKLPTRAHPGDAGLDLHAAEVATIEPGERAMVGTGVAVAIPDGCAGLVLPRSGNAARHGIALVNAPGLIDAGYRGELRVLLLNTDKSEPFEIAPGDRIAQLLITPFATLEPIAVEELEDSSRGEDGFGSSGR